MLVMAGLAVCRPGLLAKLVHCTLDSYPTRKLRPVLLACIALPLLTQLLAGSQVLCTCHCTLLKVQQMSRAR